MRDVVARAAAAAPAVAAATPAERRRWLVAVADALEDPQTAAELLRVADRETALGEARLTGELARCADQLRFYGDVAAEASYLRVTVDHRTATTPDLRRMQVPLGPVAVLGASNFPFAFGALGNDTGSALAAGCPVVAKAHPAHPETSALLATVATAALAAAGAPDGAFGLVAGFEAGEALVRAPEIAAVAFTGSQRGGLALWRLANQRDVVIPVYAEMGTVNPVVMTTARRRSPDRGDRRRLRRLLHPRHGSVLHQAGSAARPGRARRAGPRRGRPGGRAAERLAAHRGHRRRLRRGVAELVGAGAELLGRVPGPEAGWSADATVLAVPAADLKAGLAPSRGVLRPRRPGGRVRRPSRARRGAGRAAGSARRERDVRGPRGPGDRPGWSPRWPRWSAGSPSTTGRPGSPSPGPSSTAVRGRPRRSRPPRPSAPPHSTGSPDRSPGSRPRRRRCPRPCATTTRGGCRGGWTAGC